MYKTYGGLIVGKKFEPAGFAAPLGQKDIRLTLAAAENLGVPMPLASLLRDRFLALIAQGGGALDWSAIARARGEGFRAGRLMRARLRRSVGWPRAAIKPGNVRGGVHNPSDVSFGDDKMRAIAPVFIALVLAVALSGCDRCGDWYWQGGAKSCHDESQVK